MTRHLPDARVLALDDDRLAVESRLGLEALDLGTSPGAQPSEGQAIHRGGGRGRWKDGRSREEGREGRAWILARGLEPRPVDLEAKGGGRI